MEDIDGGLHPAVDGQILDDEMMMMDPRNESCLLTGYMAWQKLYHWTLY